MKYISASLVTVSRILDPPIPRYVDLRIRVCTTTRAKTARSVGSVRWAQWKEWRVKEDDEMPTKGKTERHLNDRENLFDFGKTHMI